MGLVACFISLITFACVIALWLKLDPKEIATVDIPWVPVLRINLSFLVDGLSLFFGILVTGMGALVNFYSNFYMDHTKKGIGRFYCCMTFFMGTMLGTVFADDLMLVYIFWELTGLISFLLIGFHRNEIKASLNARLALLVTFLTGMFLFIGIILIGILDETFQWTDIIAKGINFSGHDFWAYPIIIFFLIGIFGKSAQLPFHFWLPRAMVAPTPVSAYLHAATMVKLGIYLTARMYPLFVTIEGWFPMVTSVCYATMLFGAVLSLLSNNLKELLAYATISQLGFFLGFYGIGGPEGVQYDFFHIFNHALYKGSLFMLAGIITMSTGIRDIRYLGGLWKKLPITACAFFLATAAMAGVPGTTGFLSKELILTDLLDMEWHSGIAAVFGVLIFAMIFKVAFSFRLFYHVFVRERTVGEFQVVKPGFLIQLSPLILSFLSFLFGVWPSAIKFLTGHFLVESLHLKQPGPIQLLHGWEYETFVSLGILAAGILLFMLAEKSNLWWTKRRVFDWGGAWEKIFAAIPARSKAFTDVIHTKRLDVYLAILMVGFVFVIFGSLSTFSFPADLIFDPFAIIIALLIGFSAFFAVVFHQRLAKLLSLSISGFLVTFYFVLYAAPDLAMTQLLVEVATLLILLMVFSSIKVDSAAGPTKKETFFKTAVSLGVGAAASFAVLALNSRHMDGSLPAFFFLNSPVIAKGSNVVNTILVDFRGLDTLGETTVLVIASLGIWGMLYKEKGDGGSVELIPSIILKSLIPFIFVLINVFSLYLLLRGHNLPGGGFIAGLASGISVILLLMIYQTEQIISITRLNAARAPSLGLLLMTVVSSFPLMIGKPLLSHHLFGLKTPLLFDIGVYLAVLGVVIKIFFSMRINLLEEELDAV